MRVLIIPELYRPKDASANATLNDAVTWVEQWLRLDETLHVYWLLPHRGVANYERPYVLADRERVTLIEADYFMQDTDVEWLFTESGYTGKQLRALQRRIYDRLGYVDIVVDQLRQGREELLKWLLYLSGHRPDEPKPFDLIVNVHDLMLPFKYPGDGYRDTYHRRLEVTRAVLSDGIWFKARLDASELPIFGESFLPSSVIEASIDAAVLTDSPIDFSQFEETYSETPEWFHIAGSGWAKKHTELLIEIAKDLHDQYGIRTIITSMESIPSEYTDYPWVEAYPEASLTEYRRMLEKGDLAVCATEYDTLARTWFEQAASGQVLVIREEPWIRDCVPSDSPLVVPVAKLRERTRWAVENWDLAVAANRRLTEHVRAVRNPERAGKKTYADMAWRVAEKTEAYSEIHERSARREKRIGNAIDRLDAERLSLRELDDAGTAVTRDGETLLSQEWCSLADLVFALRARGYFDRGNPGTPEFQRATNDGRASAAHTAQSS